MESIKFRILLLTICVVAILQISLFSDQSLSLWVILVSRALLLLYSLYLLTWLFVKLVIKNKNLDNTYKNILLTLYACTVLFALLEISFTFVAQSHAVSGTYANRNWYGYFWKFNELNFRDNHRIGRESQKAKAFVLGDSFTTGYGVNSEDDRYSAVLQTLINDSYDIINLGKNGADTRREIDLLTSYPMQADLLILQYVGNDILPIATALGSKKLAPFQPYAGLNRIEIIAIKGSYFLNYFYWYYLFSGDNAYAEYVEFIKVCYSDESILDAHLTDLNNLIRYCKKNDIPMVVAIFPFLNNIEFSKVYIDPVGNFLDKKGIPYINLTDAILKLPVKKRTVSRWDAHPSVGLHKVVANQIYSLLLENGLMDQ